MKETTYAILDVRKPIAVVEARELTAGERAILHKSRQLGRYPTTTDKKWTNYPPSITKP